MDFLLILWLIPSLYLIFHYLFFHSRLIFFKNQKGSFKGPVTVVICAKNEGDNIARFLPKVLIQDYPDFEVLVVNDGSSDHTQSVLKDLQNKYDHLTILESQNDENYIGKKKALALGLNSAKHECLLLTDADCEPTSNQWLRNMVSQFSLKSMVFGFGGINKNKTFVNLIARWEILQTVIEYSSLALAGKPYMGVGRNIAYKKYLFKESNQFERHLHLPSGDDDLFVSEVVTSDNVALDLDSESFTFSDGPKNFQQWKRQKRRQMSTSTLYSFWPKTILFVYGFSQLSFYLILPMVIYLHHQETWLWLFLAVKIMVQYVVITPSAFRFKSAEVLWLMPVLELVSTLMVTLAHLQNVLFGQPKAWK